MQRKPYWFENPNPEEALEEYLWNKKDPYDQWKFESLLSLLPTPLAGLEVLDYGCGGGQMTVYCAQEGAIVTAADASSCSLGACKLYTERANVADRVEVVLLPPSDCWQPLEAKAFDLIIAKDVVEHIPNDTAFFAQIRNHLKPGGMSIITTQNSYSWHYRVEAPRELAKNPQWCGWNPTHVRFYNPPMLKGKLMHAGLRPLAWRGVYLVPFLAWKEGLLSKIRKVVSRLVGESAFFWPERFIGGIWPFYTFCWSLTVVCTAAKIIEPGPEQHLT